MATTTPPVRARRKVTERTMAEAFLRTTEAFPDDVAIRTRGDEQTVTWGQWRARSQAIAGGLAARGLQPGECVAILLANRPEFHLIDIAAMLSGATPFSIYQTYAPNQIEYVCSDSEARFCFVERQFLENLLEARKALPKLTTVIVVDPGEEPLPEGEGLISLAELEAAGTDGEPFDLQAAAARIDPEDVLTLIYTSGTTGPPKGVQLCHRNLMEAMKSVEAVVEFAPGDRVISWLPAAHIAERGAHHYLPILFALQITSCPNAREVMQYLPEVRPQWFFAVPRIWEKLKSGRETMRAGLPDEQRQPAEASLAAAIEKVRLEQSGREVPAELAATVAEADAKSFSHLRTMLGLDQIRAVNVGAAPTPVEVLEFFHAIGIPVAELWGMSETCGAGTVNPPHKVKIGTVGPPVPGVQLQIAQDGEVLMRGDVVMLGYRNAPEKTAEAIDPEGWLHTGDIGVIDEDGYLKIVDRKKELIINAAGKNMSPANIEASLKASSPLIGQAAAIGDRRAYNTALIVLDADFAPAWAAKHGLEAKSLEDLAVEPAMIAAVQEGVDAANAKLARVEQIKRFTLVRGDWLPGGDELTPTMKLKRKPIDAKYSEEIEGMYR
jgi:long-chain acyl-CoA synthetase